MTDPKLEAHLRASNRLLRKAADVIWELADDHPVLREIDNYLQRSREL